MTWIRLDCSLTRHPKVARFAKAMNIGRHEAIGILVDLWTWAVDYCDGDGDLSKYSSDEILTALGVGQQAALIQVDLIEALLTAGLLDRQGERLTLHDWDEHQGQLVAQREANRERQRRYRQKKKGDTGDAVTPSNITDNAPVTPSHGATNERTNDNVDNVRTKRPADRHDDYVVLEHEGLTPITEGDCKKWRELFPSVDLDVELEKMYLYLEASPKSKKPKASLPRFAMNWLQRASKDAEKEHKISDKETKKLERRRAEDMAWLEKIQNSPGGVSKHVLDQAKRDMHTVFNKRTLRKKKRKAASE